MEEKKLNEQESLELITQMINQTKKETAVGSGDTYLVWGYLCTFISLAVFALAFISKDGRWAWLYIAIPLVGFILSGIVARYISKKYEGPKTYQAQSISSIWGVSCRCVCRIYDTMLRILEQTGLLERDVPSRSFAPQTRLCLHRCHP